MPVGQRRRQEEGGRSARYSGRRVQRGITASHAPGWTDGAALAVQRRVRYLTTHRRDRSVAAQLGVILSAATEVELFMKPLRLGLIDDAAARAMLLWRATRLADITSPRQRFKRCQNISKVLRDRTRRMEPEELSISPVSCGTGTFRRWLTDDPAHERPRPLPRTFRLWKSLRRWPVAHLRGPAVVCFERAIGRLAIGAGRVPSAEDVTRVVATRILPTAVTSPADHYVIFKPGSAPRFLSVGEVALMATAASALSSALSRVGSRLRSSPQPSPPPRPPLARPQARSTWSTRRRRTARARHRASLSRRCTSPSGL